MLLMMTTRITKHAKFRHSFKIYSIIIVCEIVNAYKKNQTSKKGNKMSKDDKRCQIKGDWCDLAISENGDSLCVS